jgi:hypothetical protein
MFKVFATYKTVEAFESDAVVLDKIFSSAEDAEVYVSSNEELRVKPLTVLNHLEDGEEYVREQDRRSGLAKLTGAELKALGLS